MTAPKYTSQTFQAPDHFKLKKHPTLKISLVKITYFYKNSRKDFVRAGSERQIQRDEFYFYQRTKIFHQIPPPPLKYGWNAKGIVPEPRSIAPFF